MAFYAPSRQIGSLPLANNVKHSPNISYMTEALRVMHFSAFILKMVIMMNYILTYV